jgi:hypothetical protein
LISPVQYWYLQRNTYNFDLIDFRDVHSIFPSLNIYGLRHILCTKIENASFHSMWLSSKRFWLPCSVHLSFMNLCYMKVLLIEKLLCHDTEQVKLFSKDRPLDIYRILKC